MRNKICAILMAGYLISGCSSSGGTDGGAGGLGTTGTEDIGLLLFAALVAIGSSSVDTKQDACGADSVEPGLTTATGTFTVNYENVVDTTNGLFPEGITLDNYTVTYSAQSGLNAPSLSPRAYSNTRTITGQSGSAAIPVVLVDVGFTIPEFAAKKGDSNTIHTYRVTVTYKGRTLAGKAFQVVASTNMELGNFDRCSGSET